MVRFRQVIAILKGPGSPPTSTAASATSGPPCGTVNTTVPVRCTTPAVAAAVLRLGDCAHPVPLSEPTADDPVDQPIAACGRASVGRVYVLAPAYMSGADVKAAAVFDDATQGWLVTLAFTAKGTSDFGKLTAAVTDLPPPLNQLAIMLDGVAVSSPVIAEAITAGRPRSPVEGQA